MKAMNSSLLRTASGPIQKPLLPRLPTFSLSTHARSSSSISLNSHSPHHSHTPPMTTINRSFSETDSTESLGADRARIGAYYEEMLKSNPTEALLLGNYGKFLHQVEKDAVRAEEYYGRAILASPGDGELLSLYGRLIWETQRDEGRAESYFEHAIHASPNDCSILGSYAHFMWEAEEEEELEECDGENRIVTEVTAAIVN